MIDATLETKEDISLPQKPTDTQKKLARAMQFCGDVARLYKRKGQPPVWISVTGSANRQSRRKG
jgi:hypothetical protein